MGCRIGVGDLVLLVVGAVLLGLDRDLDLERDCRLPLVAVLATWQIAPRHAMTNGQRKYMAIMMLVVERLCRYFGLQLA